MCAYYLQKLDVLAVDSDPPNRIRMKQATSAVATFGKFHQASSLDEALRKLSTGESLDIIFIAENLNEGLSNFIREAKTTPVGQDTAYVLVVRAKEGLQTQMASSLLAGVDGFLQEPYCVDAIHEITELSMRVKKERAEAREYAAIKFLMQQISDKISTIAQLKAAGLDGRREMRKLVEMCVIFDSLDELKRQQYMDAAYEVFRNAPIPPKFPAQKYGGVSDRVKRRMEAKILSKIAGNEGKDTKLEEEGA